MKVNNKLLVNFGFDIFGDKKINSATTSSNFLLFSIYEVQFSEQENIKAVAILNNFISLSKDSEKIKEEIRD